MKEALFSALGGEIYDADFLDLFAGTGAIGIEALSRGAVKAVFVERSRSASVIRENLARTRLSGEIIKADFRDAIKRLGSEGRAFNVVFMDPPYDSGYARNALEAVERYGVLRPRCIVVAEQRSNDPPLDPPSDALTIYKIKSYKTTRFTFFIRETDESEETS
jgi:16S rRNA (guanine(966)-N(2))-methyltransferase RsmD